MNLRNNSKKGYDKYKYNYNYNYLHTALVALKLQK